VRTQIALDEPGHEANRGVGVTRGDLPIVEEQHVEPRLAGHMIGVGDDVGHDWRAGEWPPGVNRNVDGSKRIQSLFDPVLEETEILFAQPAHKGALRVGDPGVDFEVLKTGPR
jgi:hypothetical protein